MTIRELHLLPEDETLTADWGNYYRLGWATREVLAEEVIAGGETFLPRILNRFEALDERLKLSVQADAAGNFTGKVTLTETDASPLSALLQSHAGVIGGQSVPMRPYVRFDVSRLLADFSGNVDAVAELGAGYGTQLFRLFFQGAPRTATYYCRELSESGCRLARRLGGFLPEMTLDVDGFDFTTPDLSFLHGHDRVLLFVNFAFCMARNVPWAFFEALAEVPGKVTFVAIEPLGFQVEPASPCSTHQPEALNGRINVDFYDGFRRAVEEGILDQIYVGPHYFGRDLNAVSIASLFVAEK